MRASTRHNNLSNASSINTNRQYNDYQTIKVNQYKIRIVYTPAPMPVWSLLGDFLLPWTLLSWWVLGSNLLLVAES
jgi:hypothetical protein